jgi:hypothetical protein
VKHIIGINLALLTGGLIGFFGVFASVFSDGALKERLTAIAVILLIYYFISEIWGYLLPDYSWKWGLFIGVPGVLFLGFYMLRGFNAYYLIYMVLIICKHAPALGAAVLSETAGKTAWRERLNPQTGVFYAGLEVCADSGLVSIDIS